MSIAEAWQLGADLSRSWFHLAPETRWRKFEYPEATRRASSEQFQIDEASYQNADPDERKAMREFIGRQMMVRSPVRSKEAQCEMKAWLLHELRSGRLIGVGKSDTTSQALSAVPLSFWDPDQVDWEKGVVGPTERRFSEVRVVMPEIVHRPEAGEKARSGRPSQSDKVECAINFLLSSNSAFGLSSRKVQYEAVRSYIRDELHIPIDSDFSNPVIQRALVAMAVPVRGRARH